MQIAPVIITGHTAPDTRTIYVLNFAVVFVLKNVGCIIFVLLEMFSLWKSTK